MSDGDLPPQAGDPDPLRQHKDKETTAPINDAFLVPRHVVKWGIVAAMISAFGTLLAGTAAILEWWSGHSRHWWPWR